MVLVACLTGLITALAPGPLQAEVQIDGNAVMTSRSGPVDFRDAAGTERSVQPRKAFLPAELEWITPKGSQAFFTFSNGTALGIGDATRLRCLEYRQRPFPSEMEGFEYEPSTSVLTLELESGRIALAAPQLSAVSQLVVRVPHGTLRLHRGIAVIQYDEDGLHLRVIEGNLSYHYPDNQGREFVSGGQYIRISDQSARRQQVAERRSLEDLPSGIERLHLATQHARTRVLFKANAAGTEPPQAFMVVSSDYYQQASPRPYEFK
ncbi:MAG: hypothetical protein EA353_11575 [Puniceicoccaceae bacterium]|nr:MAG: hypothetical protein EA353_11575 [Puniceicoccaceae bacterium]